MAAGGGGGGLPFVGCGFSPGGDGGGLFGYNATLCVNASSGGGGATQGRGGFGGVGLDFSVRDGKFGIGGPGNSQFGGGGGGGYYGKCICNIHQKRNYGNT